MVNPPLRLIARFSDFIYGPFHFLPFVCRCRMSRRATRSRNLHPVAPPALPLLPPHPPPHPLANLPPKLPPLHRRPEQPKLAAVHNPSRILHRLPPMDINPAKLNPSRALIASENCNCVGVIYANATARVACYVSMVYTFYFL